MYIPASKAAKKSSCTHLSQEKKVFQECWLSFLKRSSQTHQKDILTIMPTRIIPHFTKPQLLMDFLTDSYDSGTLTLYPFSFQKLSNKISPSGGVSSLLSLNGLFELIQKKNLDYPNFFPKLYALFDRNLMHVKYRSRFFRLVEMFLSSTHLPAVLVASFMKRMCRLCLTAPPAAIVTVIPFIYNLLRLHPTCTFLLHRVTKDTEYQAAMRKAGFQDPFDEEETDPMKTGALESSLWELEVCFLPHFISWFHTGWVFLYLVPMLMFSYTDSTITLPSKCRNTSQHHIPTIYKTTVQYGRFPWSHIC